jgi:hypothetical protein
MKDTFFAYELIKFIVQNLKDAELKYIKQRKQDLVRKNTELGGSPDGFRHCGWIYSNLDMRQRSMGNYKPVNDELRPEVVKLEKEEQELDGEMDRIKQGIYLVLRGCDNKQEAFDALPNCLHDLLPKEHFGGLERTMPEAWTLIEGSDDMAAYQRIREKIDYYVASRLIH